MLKRFVSSAAVAALIAFGASIPLRAEVLEQVLVKVNGDIVTKTEFERLQVEFLRQKPELQNASAESPVLQKAVAESTPQLILQAIDEILMVQRGRELGYVMSDEQFKSVLDNIKKDNNIDTDEKFNEALKQENMTLADLRKQLEKNMLETRVQQNEVLAKKGEFTTPSSMMLREILVNVPTDARGVNVAADDAAKAKAEDIRHRLLSGEPFAKLAGEVSDSPSKTNGGLIGPISSDDLAPALQQAFAKMSQGDITDVIRMQRGYEVFQLDSKTEPKIKSFEDAHNDITDKIAEDKRKIETEKYIEKLRAQASITWHNDELKKAYDQALAQRQKELGV
jgi:parvulin-like peptidyl-prolyl isomerase